MSGKSHDLDGAYALRTPEDSVRYYGDWATSYDSDFAADMDYRSPDIVAGAFVSLGGAGPVLDVGAGTGLVAEALARRGIAPVDGIDISEKMLDIAAAKGVYRTVIQADLTRPLPIENSIYSGIISAGTFTHGHVGPAVFHELLRVAAPGAVFAVTVHSAVYEAGGFAARFAELGDRIEAFRTDPFKIYGPAAGSDHADDVGWIVSFRKA
ncbi:class I SAM-dependent DNA methyltransferase [Defluviimonas sp. SAOS-178_SWC]|uniref:class I SAM-dependent DNA methyltransferase n=1 Tax=Defluviimonas sp. SAOS-178_SWC TaxID=3121287 RepID=UPI0032216F10